ncbi:hypothetical protein ACI79D_02660 [Geodermatophilus sp. SYSU D00708]
MRTTSRSRPVDRTEPAAPAGNRAPPITAAALARQVADVLGDVPRFLAAPLRRRRHRTWGATEEEVAAAMPGDDLFPSAQYRCTRAVTIAAPPDEVWPWLVQVGYRRGGWYADDLLDDFARPSAREIVPELQDLHVGQWLAFVPRPSERTAFRVDGFVVPEWLLWRTPNRTWAWRLRPLPGGRTRLVTRLHTVYEWRRPWVLVTVLLMEVGDYPMMRRMLLNIRDRAEAEHRRRARSAAAGAAVGR